MRFVLPLLLASACAAACTRGPRPSDDESTEAPPAPARPSDHGAGVLPTPEVNRQSPSPIDPAEPRVAGVRFRAPAPFTSRPTNVAMRRAEYVVAAPSGGEEAILSVHHFPGMGGSVEANLARWIGQFAQPDGRPSREVARVETATVNGLEVTRVDVSGTYTGMQPGSGAPAAPREGHRLLGAIVQAPEGPLFFKLVGPAPLVDSAAAAFDELVASIEPAR